MKVFRMPNLSSIDEHKHGDGLFEFVTQKTKKYEPNRNECICSEFTISKKKWICFNIYIGHHQRKNLRHSLKK